MRGWAGPGYPNLYDGDELYTLFVVEGEDWGTISISGNFARDDEAPLPASIALLLYIHDENDETNFVRGDGVMDLVSGNFTANTTGFPVGYSRGILSFVVLDAAEAVENEDPVFSTVFDMEVVNEGCSNQLNIRLEWASTDPLDLWVADPNGDKVNYYIKATVSVFVVYGSV